MTGYTHEELLAVHEQLVGSEDSLVTGGGIGIEDSGTSSMPCADGGKEPSVVVKIGGVKAVDPKGVVPDVAHLVTNGTDMVVVHGDSVAVNETLEELGEESMYVESPSGVSGRFTDERTMEVFSMVTPGRFNTDLTALFREAGIGTLGLLDVDDGLLIGPRKSAICVAEDGKKKIKRGDHSGKVTSVNATLLETLFDGGYMPIVTVPMFADDGVPVSIDADRAATAVAGTLSAKLVAFTDAKGVYADPGDGSTLAEAANTPEGFSALESAVEGSMAKKIMAAKEAFSGRVAEVVIVGANLNDPIVTAPNGGGAYVTPGVLAEAKGAEQ